MARIQPCPRKLGIELGYYNGKEIYPRTLTERNISFFIINNHFCLKWKSEGVSFNDVKEFELKNNFRIVDKYKTEENLNSHLKYEFVPKKIESHLTNFVVYDIETHNTDRNKPFCIPFYRLSKFAGRYKRDLTPYEKEKCQKRHFSFYGW